MLGSPTHFRLDLETQLALGLEEAALVDHFQAASLARRKRWLAMLAETTPFIAVALVNMLLVEAHGVDQCPYAESARGVSCPGCLYFVGRWSSRRIRSSRPGAV